MATSIVKVYDRGYGRWAEGVKVVLGWDGITSLGMSKPVYTSANGMAVIEHSSTGRAEVYIGGSFVGKMDTPGSAVFEI